MTQRRKTSPLFSLRTSNVAPSTFHPLSLKRLSLLPKKLTARVPFLHVPTARLSLHVFVITLFRQTVRGINYHHVTGTKCIPANLYFSSLRSTLSTPPRRLPCQNFEALLKRWMLQKLYVQSCIRGCTCTSNTFLEPEQCGCVHQSHSAEIRVYTKKRNSGIEVTSARPPACLPK